MGFPKTGKKKRLCFSAQPRLKFNQDKLQLCFAQSILFALLHTGYFQKLLSSTLVAEIDTVCKLNC